MKKIYTVKNDYGNTRLDRWFKRNINQIPQSLIEKNLRKGKIKVNNRKVKSSYKLLMNDQVILYDFVFSPQKKKGRFVEQNIPVLDTVLDDVFQNKNETLSDIRPSTLLQLI